MRAYSKIVTILKLTYYCLQAKLCVVLDTISNKLDELDKKFWQASKFTGKYLMIVISYLGKNKKRS